MLAKSVDEIDSKNIKHIKYRIYKKKTINQWIALRGKGDHWSSGIAKHFLVLINDTLGWKIWYVLLQQGKKIS